MEAYKSVDKMCNIYTIVLNGSEIMNKYEYMTELLQENNVYLFTAQVENAGISRTYLAKYENSGESHYFFYLKP